MSANAPSIYVQIFIQGAVEDVWRLTQTPHLHEQWDLRFTHITYRPRPDETQPQRFHYSTRIGFGLKIEGEGETVGDQTGLNGQKTSALKFWSADPKSLIREGTGYWKYTPAGGHVRFETGYDYDVRFGLFGALFDRFIFRPLIGWATAWSFDRLRLWAEKNITPAISLERSVVHALARLMVAFVWLYQGLVPKLIFRHPDEAAMLGEAGLPAAFVVVIGALEVGIGLLMILAWRTRGLFLITIALMLAATFGVSVNSPQYLVAAFNPVTLNVMLMVLSTIGFLSGTNIPSARQCRRTKDMRE